MADAATPVPSLWQDRAFVLFWLAGAVSVAGSVITSVVLPILVFQLTGSALSTALLSSLTVVPYLLFGLLAGALADRIPRRRLMVGADLLNALLLASVPVAVALGVLSMAQLYLVAFLSATLFVWFDAANFGALPTLVGHARVLEANSLVWGTSTVLSVAMPPVGALLATTLGAPLTLGFDALSYALSAVALALVPRAFSGVRQAAPPGVSALKQVQRDIGDGLSFLWQHPLVRTMTLLGFGVSFSGGAVFGLIVVFVVRVLGLSDDDPRLGWFFTAAALGALAATLLLPRLKRFPPGRIYLAGLWFDLALMLLFLSSSRFWLSLVLYALFNLVHTLIIINGITLRQVVTPEHLQSRVNATGRMIAWGGTPFGALIAGILAESLGVRVALFATCAALAVSALAALRSPLTARNLAVSSDGVSGRDIGV